MITGFRRQAVRLLALICAGGLLLPEAARSDDLSDGRFRDAVIKQIRIGRPDVVIDLGPDPAQLIIGTKTLDLTNLHQQVRDLSEAERRRDIADFLGIAFAKAAPAPELKDFAAIKARLRVQLVPDEILQQSPQIAHRRFSETLHVVYVLDEPQRYQYVTQAMMEGWRIDPGAVETTAVKNLAATSRDAPFQLVLADRTPIMALARDDDNYAVARLLVPDYLEQIRKALKVDSITLAGPTRNMLMAWPARSPARRELATEAARQMRAGPYGRTDELFRFDRSGLRPLNAAERADHGR
jgi:hypothetical protein